MQRIPHLVSALLASLALVACSSDDDDPLATASSFCAEWGRRACTPGVVDRCAASSPEQCELSQTRACIDRLPADLYNAQGAQRCLDYVSATLDNSSPALSPDDLDALYHWGFPCNRVLSGPGGSGERCESTADCRTVDQLECLMRPGQQVGECHAPETVPGGSRCSASYQVCAEGFFCNGTHCVAPLELGDDCDLAHPCGAGLKCSPAEEASEMGTCVRQSTQGAACTDDTDCTTGLCSKNSADESGLCTRELVLSAGSDLCAEYR